MKKQLFVILTVIFLLITYTLQGKTPPVKWQWSTSTPEQQQLNSSVLQELVSLMAENKTFRNLHSLLVVRNGYLVLEKYFAGFSREKPHTLQSVSKSFTSALIGIAIGQGKIKGVHEKILGFFPHVKGIKHMDKRKTAMKLQDLLTMRGGTDYHERGSTSPHRQLIVLEKGWDLFYLDRPMLNEPGTHFRYDSGGVILLSSILKNRTGLHADTFARKYLFDPLYIEGEHWFKNKENHPHTGGGLHLKPRDMAKLGQLYLQKGRWQGKQVIPETWVKQSFQEYVSHGPLRRPITGYGYLWWIMKPDPKGQGKENIYAAWGYQGQFIFVIPEHNMVVVFTGGTTSGYDEHQPFRAIYSHILPAVKR